MRACAAVFFCAAVPCFIYAQTLHSPREFISNSIGNKNRNSFPPVVPCVTKLGFTKCVSAYSVWKAERALRLSNSSDTFHQDSFPWRQYINTTDEELYLKLCDGTEKLLQRRPLVMNLGEYSLELGATEAGKLHLDLLKEKETASGRGTMKKLHKMMGKMLPLLVVPGLIMSAILPFFLPSLKLMTIAVGYLNQMALMGAVFTLLRNHAFGDGHKTKVVYLNEGYLHDKYEHLADTHSETFAEPDFDTKFNNMDPHELKDYNFFSNNGASSFYNSAEWMKPASHINMQNDKILDEINRFNWGQNHNNNDFKQPTFSKKNEKEVLS